MRIEWYLNTNHNLVTLLSGGNIMTPARWTGALALAACAGTASAGPLVEKLINFKVVATLEKVDVLNSDLYFRFAGPMIAPRIDPATGRIDDSQGPHVGEFSNALVRFHIDLSKSVTDSEFFTFSCSECRIDFDDGGRLAPIAPPNGDDFIPMQGRGLPQLGVIAKLSDGTLRIRGAGCGGTQEVGGVGELAGMRGVICMNGSFGLPYIPTDLSKIDIANFPVMHGESDCSIYLHQPE
mgnify:CR=1 FL=1